MADALASGASDRKVVWVQVPSPAPVKSSYLRAFSFCPNYLMLVTVLLHTIRYADESAKKVL